MEDEADAFIITPGGIGTFEEFFEILTLKQLGRHKKPIAIYNINGYFDSLDKTIDNAIEEGFIKDACHRLYKLFDDVNEMVKYIENDHMEGLTLHDFK